MTEVTKTQAGDGLDLTRAQLVDALTTAAARAFADLGVRCAANREAAAKLAQRAAELLLYADQLARNEDEGVAPANLLRLADRRAHNDNAEIPF